MCFMWLSSLCHNDRTKNWYNESESIEDKTFGVNDTVIFNLTVCTNSDDDNFLRTPSEPFWLWE